MQRGSTYALLYLVLMTLFFIPMHKPFSDMLVSLHSSLLMVYWCALTSISIAMGFRILNKVVKSDER